MGWIKPWYINIEVLLCLLWYKSVDGVGNNVKKGWKLGEEGVFE